ncbi:MULTISPECIES: glycoside hydrolase family 5 protein [Microbacterium]|uniref:glycoside hydrolase family 5 protein n=1 Tax=Microbacterium TaxID=33882 RepID=UPI0006FD75AE|nr:MULTISPECIES: cellulase family glycosylhydrolase [Microbacterium]KQR23432.1 hypothetical protein ASF76_09605 [Microbacterium sp. Leaf151]MCI9857108.1 cellulase family glycosylhydrolase [Microbacterium proteolyticum]
MTHPSAAEGIAVFSDDRPSGRRRKKVRSTTALAALTVAAVSALAGCVPTPSPDVVPVPADAFETYLEGRPYLRGVNVYGHIFGGAGAQAGDFAEPESSYRFLAARGIDIVRLPIPWQRLQVIPDGGSAEDGLAQPVDAGYLDAIAEEVASASAQGVRVVIDLHNGCTYPWGAGPAIEGSVRCGDGITEDHVKTVWAAIAGRFRDDPGVAAFDVFNEPRWSVGVETYKHFAQVAVDAIRSTGATQPVWVEGLLSDTRGRLSAIAPNGPWIVDPTGRVIYSEHFYATSSGPEWTDVDQPDTVLDRVRSFGEWCAKWSVRCSVGEVGWPSGGEGGVVSGADAEKWNDLFDRFYDIADEYRLDVTYFGATSTRTVGTLFAYVSSRPGTPSATGLDTALSQSRVIERHLSAP